MSDAMANPIGSSDTMHSLPSPTTTNLNNNNNPPAPTTLTETMFSAHLASALSTISDSQYFQDSISPATIRSQLTCRTLDPSNPSSTPVLLKSMKWLLASVSKGRDVSDFFPHVVKLVTAPSLEVRKMVYMYTVHYADHNNECRELALLSINSFQRGLADSEQWIRALALRVLTSVRVMDVVQIQIMAVKTCSVDKSPYVRKCAANALSKLYPRVATTTTTTPTGGDGGGNGGLLGDGGGGGGGGKPLLDLLTTMLQEEHSTMVLSSVIFSFSEMCPERLDVLHGSYRKICHLLTDMDEWGQIVVMDILTRYCRRYFGRPGGGSAELIDRERRVVRCITEEGILIAGGGVDRPSSNITTNTTIDNTNNSNNNNNNKIAQKKRFVKKAFYSDDDDSSSDEDYNPRVSSPDNKKTVVSGVRQRNVLGFSANTSTNTTTTSLLGGGDGNFSNVNINNDDDTEHNLHPDHQLLLNSSLPLLKSRNSGVVMAVCSLQYYCGVASIEIRSALGKALVRIYRDRREIMYVVLCSIRMLVWECPSAFTPFLNDFFVKAMDPSFTRLIKLDILSTLALEPKSINAVLKELRTYIRHDDKIFVCASIQAVGKIVELARIVYDRRGGDDGNGGARADANVMALNCLHGLLNLTESSEYEVVVGECVGVMQRILSMLRSDEDGGGTGGVVVVVEDPNQVRSMALRRLVLLLVRSLSSLEKNGCERDDSDDDDADEEEEEEDGIYDMKDKDATSLKRQIILLPTAKVAPALWFIGEWLSTTSSTNTSTTSTKKGKKNKTKKNKTTKTSYTTSDDSSLSLFDNNRDDDNNSGEQQQQRQAMGLELLRLIAKSFPDMDPILKSHSVHFSSKLLLSSHYLTDTNGTTAPLCEYILGMGRVDTNTDVRDRARYESHVLHMAIGLSHDSENMTAAMPSATGNEDITLENARATLLQYDRPPSSWLPIEQRQMKGSNHQMGGGGNSINAFRFGTLSSMVSHRVGGGDGTSNASGGGGVGKAYLHLPEWADEDSPTSLRDPPVQEENTTRMTTKTRNHKNTNQRSKKVKKNKRAAVTPGFYDSDDSEHDSSSSSSSSSGEESTDDATTSNEDSTDEDDESTSSSSSSSEDESSEEESSSEEDTTATDEDDDGGGVAVSNTLLTMGGTDATNNTPPQPLPTMASRGEMNLKSTPSSSDDDDESFSSSDDNESSSSSEEEDKNNNEGIGSLLHIPNSQPPSLIPLPSATTSTKSKSSLTNTTGVESLTSGLEGLVMAPLPKHSATIATAEGEEGDIETNSSEWKTLVRHDLSGGLKLDVRFLRGAVKEREAKECGIVDPTMSGGNIVVCVQIRIENRRSDKRVLRRIRIFKNSNTKATIPTTRTSLPNEIELLQHSQISYSILTLQFASASDREDAISARFDVKSDRGSTSMTIRPPLGEMLSSWNVIGGGSSRRMNDGEFDMAVGRLQGIHQRSTASFSLVPDDDGNDGSFENQMDDTLVKISKAANLNPIGNQMVWNIENQCKLMGRLPASGTQVLILVKCNPKTGVGEIIVCCDNTMALNTIMELLKGSVVSA